MKTSDRKLTPLQELRREKAKLKEACRVKENEMATQFTYMYENLGSIIGSALLHDISKRLGFGGHKSQPKHAQYEDTDNTPPSSTIKQTVINGLQVTYPYIKEFVQPLVLGFVANKVKGLFSSKSKKRIEGKKRKGC